MQIVVMLKTLYTDPLPKRFVDREHILFRKTHWGKKQNEVQLIYSYSAKKNKTKGGSISEKQQKFAYI